MNTPDFSLLESMRWTNEIALLDWHLARLVQAAVYFDFPYDESRICRALEEAERELELGQRYRVRLTLQPDGTPRVTTAALNPEADRIQSAAVYPDPIDASGPFWRHKTLRRRHYAKPLYWAQTQGYDEAILVNARGEVIEGTRTNLWIERDGRLLTPPMREEGLAGVFRSHLLTARPDTDEAVLLIDDLRTADAVYVSNAVLGLQPVQLDLAVVEGQAA